MASKSGRVALIIVGASFAALAGLVLMAAISASVLKAYVVQPFAIPTASMAPAIQAGDRVLVDRRVYRTRPPRVGEIVVFDDPTRQHPALIKRVAAVAGQSVDIRDGDLYVDGQKQTVAGVPEGQTQAGSIPLPVTIPAGYVWLMGDNRPNSADSRFLGPTPVSALLGRVFYIYMPPSRQGPVQ